MKTSETLAWNRLTNSLQGKQQLKVNKYAQK